MLMAIDPGAEHDKHVTSERGTGWALFQVHLGTTNPPTLEAYGQIVGGPDEFMEAMVDDVAFRRSLNQADTVLVEGFKLMNMRAKTDPLLIIGMVRMYALMAGKKPAIVQPPRGRTLVDHDDLKRINMWPGGKGHADTAQAIRHGLSYLLNNGHVGTQMLVQPDEGD